MRSCSEQLALAAILTLLLAGCQDNLERRETISLAAGDAIEANKAIHIIDPWPARSVDTRIPTSARRVADAIERYEARANGPAVIAPGPLPVAPMPIAPTGVVTP